MIFRPIEAGMCSYESAMNGTLSITDFAKMNDYLARKIHNESIAGTQNG